MRGQVAVFSSTEEEEWLLEKFFGQVTVHPDLRPKFVGANTAFHAVYTDPDAALVVDTRSDW